MLRGSPIKDFKKSDLLLISPDNTTMNRYSMKRGFMAFVIVVLSSLSAEARLYHQFRLRTV